MLNQDIKTTITAYLMADQENPIRNYIYFDFYYSSKDLNETNITRVIEATLGRVENLNVESLEKEGFRVRVDSIPILFWQIDKGRWLINYTSKHLPQSHRRSLSKAHKKIGWLLPMQFESEAVDDIYHNFSPKDESVNIGRKWDPYWIYERGSEIPENLRDYYRENMDEFVEKEIEFNVKTPGWLVDTAFKEGMQEELLDKSEISKSMFTYKPEIPPQVASDGGIQAEEFESSVTVYQDGQVIHRSGVPEATFNLMDEIHTREDIYSEFEDLVPKRESHKLENGIVKIDSFQPGGVLKVIFDEKEYNEEASITLSNLLTVGQDDVEIHGVIQNRNELEFIGEVYTPFDEGEYRVQFTSTTTEDETKLATLKIKPKAATAAGLVYLFRKLKEKFDPRITYQTEMPDKKGVGN